MIFISPGRVGTWVPYTVSILAACGAAILVIVLGKNSVPASEGKEKWRWRNQNQA